MPDSSILPLLSTAMVRCARKGGVEMIPNTPVSNWGASSEGVWVTAAGARYDADALIVTAGAWAGRMLQELNLPLTIQRKVQWWLNVEDAAQYAPERFPVFISDSEFGEIYGLPVYLSPGLKIANHAGGIQTDPDHVNRIVAEDESQDVMRFASWFLDGVTPDVLQSVVCLYARTPDGHFILDRHPEWPNVIIGGGFFRPWIQVRPGHRRASGCSGSRSRRLTAKPLPPRPLRSIVGAVYDRAFLESASSAVMDRAYRFGSALPTSSRFSPFGSFTKTLRMVSLHSTSSALRERTRPLFSLILASS